ncbi:unnamed protein product [Orchesella dallaii]|uniref:Alkyl transferase n=1 Tax=Orchesella dallaii TaxID=48710 RepID=A0ABP1RM09_9HEXA
MAHVIYQETALQKLFRNILQQGEVPHHVAIVLDGNRRYARERNMKTIGGHRKGSDLFDQTIDWAVLCGVQEVTAYVFSINNFSRPAEEVNGIMALLKEKLEYKLDHPEELKGRCYRFIGNRSLVPKDLKPVMSKLMMMTRNNTTVVINIAFAYTGRDEIVSGVNSLVNGIRKDELVVNCITESLFERSFHNFPVSPVDLFIRTGECRLSDFLTWESSDNTVLTFIEDYWPNFSYWKFLSAIFLYQASRFSISAQAIENGNSMPMKGKSQHSDEFVEKKRKREWNIVEKYANAFELDTRLRKYGD